MKYDADKEQFIYNWNVAKRGTGGATIMVTVSYPGTTSTQRRSRSPSFADWTRLKS